MPSIARVAALLLLLVAGPVRATVRVLMVGIDQYQFSLAHDPKADPKFHDLKGAVNDLKTMRVTLVTTAHLAIAPVTSGCRAVGPTSVVLTNDCAGRGAILAGWDRLMAASTRGDTVLFYFSGHGSTVIDDTDTQESGSSDTLVPYDARGREHNPEIIDLELKARIDGATARGVNVSLAIVAAEALVAYVEGDRERAAEDFDTVAEEIATRLAASKTGKDGRS